MSEVDPTDIAFMARALERAAEAAALGEVPVGAVAVKDGQVIGEAHNRREVDRDPFAHAEMLAMAQAAKALGAWRLSGVTLYVTLEPCAMCAGAVVWARVERVVVGAADPKAGFAGSLGRDPKGGAVVSLHNLVQDERHNHRVAVTEGVLADECGAVLKAFFKRLRDK